MKMNTKAALPNVQGHALLLIPLGNQLSSWVQIFQILWQTEIDYTPSIVKLQRKSLGKKYIQLPIIIKLLSYFDTKVLQVIRVV
jgi:hypothetical protein